MRSTSCGLDVMLVIGGSGLNRERGVLRATELEKAWLQNSTVYVSIAVHGEGGVVQ